MKVVVLLTLVFVAIMADTVVSKYYGWGYSNFACKVSVCLLDKEVGRCRAKIPRYYYDPAEKDCKLFYYGGCGGNGNNFDTYEECIDRCDSDCYLDAKVGPCKARIKRYFFDVRTRTCMPFFYGGCQGNGNNFATKPACLRTCRPRAPLHCILPKKVGPCKARMRRYYFDQWTCTCKVFYWGGCQANLNNFESEKECENACLN